MRIGILPEPCSKSSLCRIFGELGVHPGTIQPFKNLSAVDFSNLDILVLPQGIVGNVELFNGRSVLAVKDFVKRGGICWIMHQEREGWDSSWLPRSLSSQLRIDLRYLETMISFRGEASGNFAYAAPWVLDRCHSVWNKPNYLDESDFAEWSVKIGNRIFKTTAINAIVRQKRWHVIGGFEDHRVNLEDGAALVMEANYGKGLYFWTQILSPGHVWTDKTGLERVTWEKLMQNLLQYFKDFKNKAVLQVKTSIRPWSVNAGKPVNIAIRIPSGVKITKVNLGVRSPDGKNTNLRDYPITRNKKAVHVKYIPLSGGEHQITLEIYSSDGRCAVNNVFFKVTQGVTPYRFTNHHHYSNDWVTDSLGQTYGSAKRWGVDAVFVASGQFYQPDDMLQVITPDLLKKVDNPRTRFFPGQEIHPHHMYGIEEGVPDVSSDTRRHGTTMGCYTIKPKNWNYWDPDVLPRIHEMGGIVLVAHPHKGDSWWLKKYGGHSFDGVCLDHVDFNLWDSILKKGSLFPGVRASDCAPSVYGNDASTAWLREPLSMESIIKACINGRITFHNLQRSPPLYESAGSYIWFDICDQLVGGKVYAVDTVNLHIKIASHLVFRTIRIVKGGDRNYKILKVRNKRLDLNIDDKVDASTYYRVEAYSKTNPDLEVDRPEALTNPIFVEKVIGPQKGCFYSAKDSRPVFDKKQGRFVPNETGVTRISYKNNEWKISIREPEPRGKICIGVVVPARIRLDDKNTNLADSQQGEQVVKFAGGDHSISIQE